MYIEAYESTIKFNKNVNDKMIYVEDKDIEILDNDTYYH